MTLEHWFFLSQTIAAFATVTAVSFVALEMQNSTRERRHQTIEDVLEDLREARRALAENTDVSRIFFSGLHDFAALASVDKMRFLLTAHSLLATHEAVFFHYREGHMPREMYEPQEANRSAFLAYPGFQAAWKLRRNFFRKAFQELVDKEIAAAQTHGAVALYGEGPV